MAFGPVAALRRERMAMFVRTPSPMVNRLGYILDSQDTLFGAPRAHICPAQPTAAELFRDITLVEVARSDPSPIRAFRDRLLARSDLSLSTCPAGLRLAV